jgi:S-adenosylmethionine:tRNA ribosyltransferase-isomerase
MKLQEFDYHLPPELIAQAPVPQRDQSRLLVVNRDTGRLQHSVFAHLGDYLPENCLLVLNDTRVIPARLPAHKSKSGGKLELLLVHQIEADVWEVLIKGKVKPGLAFRVQDRLQGEVIAGLENGHWMVKFSYQGKWEDVLQAVGQVPLPPYIKGRHPNDSERYQTI